MKDSLLPTTLAMVLLIGLPGCGSPSIAEHEEADPESAAGLDATQVRMGHPQAGGAGENSGPAQAGLEQRPDVAAINQLGGKVTIDEASPARPVIEVSLCGARVTDGDLERLQGFSQLQSLDLNSTPVTDAGMVHLKGFRQLKKLNLGGSRVTDAGLEHLRGLSQLQVLWLSGTRVSDGGLRDLRKALPNCQIVK